MLKAETRRKRIELGQCVTCKKPTTDGKIFCDSHRQYFATYYVKKKEERLRAQNELSKSMETTDKKLNRLFAEEIAEIERTEGRITSATNIYVKLPQEIQTSVRIFLENRFKIHDKLGIGGKCVTVREVIQDAKLRVGVQPDVDKQDLYESSDVERNPQANNQPKGQGFGRQRVLQLAFVNSKDREGI